MAVRVSTLAVLVAPMAFGGCAGWKGRGDTYRAPSVGARSKSEASYRFGLPGGGWEPLLEVEGVQVAWSKPALVGVIEIHIQCEEQGDSSLEQYTDHLRIDWRAWKVTKQTETRLVGRAALHTLVEADLDGIERNIELWVVKKNGCLIDLRYSAAPKSFEAGRPAFAKVVEGFDFPL